MLDPIFVTQAKAFGLDVDLLRAMAAVESEWNPWVVRFEPGWRYFFHVRDWADKLGITFETEEKLQAMSWGPLQIMGAVARELGFQDMLTMLVQPEIAVRLSCHKLKLLFQKYGDETDVISAWNAGSPRKTVGGMFENQKYVDKVNERLRALRKIT